ncbi:MAG: efflux RND transporter periplasmic adaptor subunit, partial [Rhodoferax sp.]|nr:efflux RND transporter periplasmic adaptor subunit [Rhodoferax sp.]
AVEVGQRVRAGDLLAELDPQDVRLQQDAARAQVAAAQTNRDLAAADLKRFRELRDQNFISAAELERRDTAYKAAQAQLEQAQAQLAAQGNQAAYTRLLADAAGVVLSVEVEAGQVVAAGTPVLRLALDGPRDVVFAVPEDRVAGWRAGREVQVRPWSGGPGMAARVREVAASADPVTRTFAVRAALGAAARPKAGAAPGANTGRAEPALGSTVTVQWTSGGVADDPATLIKLPTSALRQEGGGSAVWVFEPASATVRLRPVQVATADGNEVVIGAGLAAGEQVVTAGVHVLSPGQKVRPYKPDSPAGGASTGSSAMVSIAGGAAGPALAASAAASR